MVAEAPRPSGPGPSAQDHAAAGGRLLDAFFRRMHLCRADEVADVIAEELEHILDARDVTLYLANYEQSDLVPVPATVVHERVPQPIDGSMAGRCFASSTVVVAAPEHAHEHAHEPAPEPEQGAPGSPERRRLWAPVLDGTDRVGVLELDLPTVDGVVPRDLERVVERFAHAVAQTVLSKSLYGDAFHHVRRTQPMALGAELLWSVLPPQTYATDGLVISAMLEPSYANGGDAFDYAVNGSTAHLAVFDGMGHGLAAAGVSTFAVSAYRHSRRAGRDLVATYREMDGAIREQFRSGRFVTAVIAELDTDTGRLSWLSAGHPPPLLLRQHRVVKTLEVAPATPLGVDHDNGASGVGTEHLEPGDMVVFYTDGFTEARGAGGDMLGVPGLTDAIQREAAAQQIVPETLRRIRRVIREQGTERLTDDATALIVEWRGGNEQLLLP